MPRLRPMRAARWLGAVGLGASITGSAGVAAQTAPRPLPSALTVRSYGSMPATLLSPTAAAVAESRGPQAGAPWSDATLAPSEEPDARLRPAALSLLVPGLGQRALGQRRGWIYLTVEAIGWALYADRRRAASDYRGQYKDFAWEVARVQAGPRIDPPFPYYETMSHWRRSGSFDADAGTEGVQPESDGTTYNGAIWSRAVGLFMGGSGSDPSAPGYAAALAYYGERAWGADFLWDWSGTGSAMDDFAGLIEASDDRARQATQLLGAIIANHLVAAVDAYLSARDRPVSLDLRGDPRGVGGTAAWEARISLRLPR